MVVMVALRGTKIRYTRLLIHLVVDDLASGVEEGGDSAGRSGHGVVDLLQFMRVTCLLSKDPTQLKSLMAMTSTPMP
jgi:hypothetical protein